jgi:hypothetical protein
MDLEWTHEACKFVMHIYKFVIETLILFSSIFKHLK